MDIEMVQFDHHSLVAGVSINLGIGEVIDLTRESMSGNIISYLIHLR
jgi:hypothetical protein